MNHLIILVTYLFGPSKVFSFGMFPLTVEQGKAKSHSDIGWQKFTNTIIQFTDKKNSIVFLLWGADAQQKKIL